MKAILFFIILVSLVGFFVAFSALQVLLGIFAYFVSITCVVLYALEDRRGNNYYLNKTLMK